MKEITINSLGKTVTVKPVNVGSAKKIMNRVASLFKRAQKDADFRVALNGLIAIIQNQKEVGPGMVFAIMPHILANFFEELVDLLADLLKLSVEEIEEMELEELVEVISTLIEINDFEKVKGLLKNFMGLLPVNLLAKQATPEEKKQ